MHQMKERFEELYAKALDAVEQAPDGQWTSAGEFAFLEVFRELRRESFEAALQARIDTHSTATAATFSPSGPGDRGSAAAAAHTTGPRRASLSSPPRAIMSVSESCCGPDEPRSRPGERPVGAVPANSKNRIRPKSVARPQPRWTRTGCCRSA